MIGDSRLAGRDLRLQRGAPGEWQQALGLGAHITFGYHLLSWIGLGPEGRAIMPEARRLPADRTNCLYGVEDPHASCGQLAAAGFDVDGLPGDHHFDRQYAHLAELIRQRIGRRQ